jgi:NADH dehydrogenase
MSDQAPIDDGRIRCRVLILGGGFGGLYTALGLERLLRPKDRTEITLVNLENFSLFTPMLCEVAGSSIDTRHAINPIRRMLRRTRFVEGEAISLDPQTRTVLVRHPGEHTHRYSYDHLVVAVGARTGFFGMRDVQEHALTAKTLGDAILVRNRVIEMLEMAVIEDDPARRAALLTFVVGGGGFTGVEIAGEVNELVRQAARAYPSIRQKELHIILLEAMPRLMPEMDEKLAGFALERLHAAGVEVRLNTRVNGATADQVSIKDGEPIPSRTLVWTSGVAPHPFVAESPLPKDGRGWVTVDAHLRVPGFPGVWALGDCARVPDILHPGHNHPAMAQHAIREADQLAHNIVAAIRGAHTRPFRYRTLGYMATIGHFNGIGLIGPFRVWGFLAWFLWRTYYLWRLPRLEKRLRVAMDWTLDLWFGRDISVIQTVTASDRYH